VTDANAFAHHRPFDPVHDRLPYQAITERAPLRWPNGERVAVWVVPNVEHYEYLPPDGPSDPYPRSPHPDVRKHGYHDYGNRVALWRMLEVFDRHDIRPTVSLNVGVLDHFPDILAAMQERHWDWMSHGTYNTRFVTGISEDEERDLLEVCDRVLERHTGERFTGMLGPFITANWHTPDLLAEHGMRYHADWVHDDRPSPLLTRSGAPFVALPYTYLLNDGPAFRTHYEGPEYAGRIMRQFDALMDEGQEGRMMCIALHPFATGQPHRVRHIDRVMKHLRDRGAWVATASEIVDHYLATAYDTDVTMALEARGRELQHG
jgi:allantoinase